MPKIRIPDQYRPGIEMLARLSAQAMQELLDVLLQESPLIRPAALISRATSKVHDIPSRDAQSIIDALFSLDAARNYFDMPLDEFVDGISQAETLEISVEGRSQLKERLQTLLDLPAVTITAKASILLNEAERRFHDARVVTDVRPIFKDGVEDAPVAAIILHNLRIRYHHDVDGRLDDIYVSLDVGDVQELRDVLDRASAKVKSLGTVLKESGVLHVESGEERSSQ